MTSHLEFRPLVVSRACCLLIQQERQEAQRLFETDSDALTAAERTFEPGEGMVEAEGAPAEDEEMEVVPEPTLRKGPTPEQITAIKV